MSVVWRASDEVLRRHVAVKVLAGALATDPGARLRIQAEARAAARLAHPHVASVYDYGVSTGGDGEPEPFVVMELLRGPTLGKRLAGGPLPVPEALRVCAEVASGIAAAHEEGLVHRDIKPSNVVLAPSGAKVVDFGIAAAAGPLEDLDESSRMVGTPAYLAPERVVGGDVMPASDVYAVGLLLHAVLTGRLPWRVETTTQMLKAHVYVQPEPMQPVPGVPRHVIELCEQCLAKEPTDRPTAAEVAAVLAEAAGIPLPGAGVGTAPPPLPPDAASGGGDRHGAHRRDTGSTGGGLGRASGAGLGPGTDGSGAGGAGSGPADGGGPGTDSAGANGARSGAAGVGGPGADGAGGPGFGAAGAGGPGTDGAGAGGAGSGAAGAGGPSAAGNQRGAARRGGNQRFSGGAGAGGADGAALDGAGAGGYGSGQRSDGRPGSGRPAGGFGDGPSDGGSGEGSTDERGRGLSTDERERRAAAGGAGGLDAGGPARGVANQRDVGAQGSNQRAGGGGGRRGNGGSRWRFGAVAGVVALLITTIVAVITFADPAGNGRGAEARTQTSATAHPGGDASQEPDATGDSAPSAPRSGASPIPGTNGATRPGAGATAGGPPPPEGGGGPRGAAPSQRPQEAAPPQMAAAPRAGRRRPGRSRRPPSPQPSGARSPQKAAPWWPSAPARSRAS
ncbi:serine/threonine protein kinase [Micromonospora sp. CPCC 205371]|nr:serine/threonine protein kinase [Micromonospora sp. CPCC 205371]